MLFLIPLSANGQDTLTVEAKGGAWQQVPELTAPTPTPVPEETRDATEIIDRFAARGDGFVWAARRASRRAFKLGMISRAHARDLRDQVTYSRNTRTRIENIVVGHLSSSDDGEDFFERTETGAIKRETIDWSVAIPAILDIIREIIAFLQEIGVIE